MALNLDDLKEQIGGQLRQTWEKFEETSLYNQIRDRFENLNPVMQKLVLAGSVALVCLLFLSFPWGHYSSSSTQVEDFQSKRELIRDLLKTSKDAGASPSIPVPPSLEAARGQIEGQLRLSQLIPEQIKPIEFATESSKIISDKMISGMLKISLAKLNLRQIVDIGYQIQNINPSLKMKDLIIEANAQDSKYFDVVYKVIALNVPQPQMQEPEPEEPPARGKKGKSKSEDDN